MKPFEINKNYSAQLQMRKALFRKVTGTKKGVFTTLITNHALKSNGHSIDCVDVSISSSDLM